MYKLQSAVSENGKFRVLILERTWKFLFQEITFIYRILSAYDVFWHEYSIPQGIEKKNVPVAGHNWLIGWLFWV